MKFFKIQNKIGWSIVAILLVGLASLGMWRVSAVETDKEKFHKQLRDGVGTEVSLAKAGDSAEVIRNSVESLSHFIEYRSGMRLSSSVKDKLIKLEAETLNGQRKMLTNDELSEVLLDTLFERVSLASSEEIEQAAETLRGFDHPNLPQEYKNGRRFVKLRASMPTQITRNELVERIGTIKNADAQSNSMYRLMASRVIKEESANRAIGLRDAMPEKYGLVMSSVTPVQSLLITYSIVSDDNMLDSAVNLKRKMKSIEQWMNKKYEKNRYPEAEKYTAYGQNGYLYASPVNLLLDEKTVNRLLDRMQEKGEIK